jgi:hypothetical protein
VTVALAILWSVMARKPRHQYLDGLGCLLGEGDLDDEGVFEDDQLVDAVCETQAVTDGDLVRLTGVLVAVLVVDADEVLDSETVLVAVMDTDDVRLIVGVCVVGVFVAVPVLLLDADFDGDQLMDAVLDALAVVEGDLDTENGVFVVVTVRDGDKLVETLVEYVRDAEGVADDGISDFVELVLTLGDNDFVTVLDGERVVDLEIVVEHV